MPFGMFRWDLQQEPSAERPGSVSPIGGDGVPIECERRARVASRNV